MSTVEPVKLFSELKEETFRRQLSNSENFDRSILTYASGALALSLGFLKDFVPLTRAAHAYLLYGSWLLFALCITLTIASYLLAQLALKRHLEIADDYYLKQNTSAWGSPNTPALLTEIFNWASGSAFCLAVFLTTAFIAINAKEASMSFNKDDKGPRPNVKIIIDDGVRKAAGVPPMTRIPGATPPIVPSKPETPAQPTPEKPRKD
ncbi:MULTISPECIES: hypothetical protein [unclassified Lysobacter]|uniref:hypothetical protein n=1 Tax=unclassified Lysobacter TaxID=2635362 RepID=UPI001C22E316|nr:hypothetical protein [Lysobacter sp. MMG2]MBU8977099.1 hypothetical protein [Lysobacter sp. MMG2]